MAAKDWHKCHAYAACDHDAATEAMGLEPDSFRLKRPGRAKSGEVIGTQFSHEITEYDEQQCYGDADKAHHVEGIMKREGEDGKRDTGVEEGDDEADDF